MTDLILPRRGFLLGLAATIAAPAIVRAESLMKLPPIIKPWKRKLTCGAWGGVIRLGDIVTCQGGPIGVITSVSTSFDGDRFKRTADITFGPGQYHMVARIDASDPPPELSFGAQRWEDGL